MREYDVTDLPDTFETDPSAADEALARLAERCEGSPMIPPRIDPTTACGWCGHKRAEHSRVSSACLVDSCQCYEWHNPPITAPPTTGADETKMEGLRDRIAQIIWVQSMAALTGFHSDHREEIWPEFRTTMGGWCAFKAADAVIAATVPDAELMAIAEWRSHHQDDMWELLDYIEAGIDEETDVAQRIVMRERFDELRALLEGSHLAGDAARTEEGEEVAIDSRIRRMTGGE